MWLWRMLLSLTGTTWPSAAIVQVVAPCLESSSYVIIATCPDSTLMVMPIHRPVRIMQLACYWLGAKCHSSALSDAAITIDHIITNQQCHLVPVAPIASCKKSKTQYTRQDPALVKRTKVQFCTPGGEQVCSQCTGTAIVRIGISIVRRWR